MSAACNICRGACCESLLFPLSGMNAEHAEFMKIRGRPIGIGIVEIEARCKSLNAKGQCGVYKERPDLCRQFEVGGTLCLDTVRRRRPASADAILDALESQMTLHEHADMYSTRKAMT